jgi:hypothetical protein
LIIKIISINFIDIIDFLLYKLTLNWTFFQFKNLAGGEVGDWLLEVQNFLGDHETTHFPPKVERREEWISLLTTG